MYVICGMPMSCKSNTPPEGAKGGKLATSKLLVVVVFVFAFGSDILKIFSSYSALTWFSWCFVPQTHPSDPLTKQ